MPLSAFPRGTTALITGASRGIGAAIARRLAAEGVRVALVARTAAPLEALAHELQGIAVPCDVSDATAVSRMATTVMEQFGDAPHILVNNAGVFRLAPLTTMPVDLFTETVQTNLVAPFLVLREFLPAMRARRSGHIVTIGSVADRMVFPENGAYSPAKYGVRALHEVLRTETRGSGIRSTLVSPGAVDTEMWQPLLTEPVDHLRQLPTRDVMLQATAVADAVMYVLTCPPPVNIDELRLTHQ